MSDKPHRVTDVDFDSDLPWGCACGWRGEDMHDHREHVKEVTEDEYETPATV